MKKLAALTISLIVMSSNVFAGEINVNLNGEKVEFAAQEPLIEEGRTLIPLRGVFEKLGYEISWDGETKTAVFKKEDTEVKVTVNLKELEVNGIKVPIDVPAQIINGTMMLPLRAVGEATGLEVNWDSENKTVSLVSNISNTETTTEETTVKTTEEETEAVTEKTVKNDTKTDSNNIADDELEVLRSAARCYVTFCSVEAMLGSLSYSEDYNAYKISGALEYSYSVNELVDIVDNAINECKKYKNVALNIKTGNMDKNVVKKFIALIDSCIDDYEFLRDSIATTKYDDLSDKQYKAKIESSTNAIKNAMAGLFAEMIKTDNEAWEIAKSEKYNAPDPDKLSGSDKAKREAYYKEIGKTADAATKFIKDGKTARNMSGEFINAANKIRNCLLNTETPNICVLDREVMLLCCDLLEQAGNDIKKGAFSDDGNNEAFIEFEYSMVTFDLLFDTILKDNYEMKYFEEYSEESDTEILDEFDSKFI